LLGLLLRSDQILAFSFRAHSSAQDDNLATILRDYIAKQKPLPGVRQNSDTAPWPATRIVRNTPDGAAAGNGRDYVQARRALIARYAEPWLLSLHNQNPDAYIDIVYDACVELAEDRTPATEFFDISTQDPNVRRFGLFTLEMLIPDSQLKSPALLNEVLYCISKVAQSSMAFSAMDALVLRWLTSVTDTCPDTTVSLPLQCGHAISTFVRPQAQRESRVFQAFTVYSPRMILPAPTAYSRPSIHNRRHLPRRRYHTAHFRASWPLLRDLRRT
jgi:hypothetical protein